MYIVHKENSHEALLLEVAMVLEDDPTAPFSCTSMAIGKTPTANNGLADLTTIVYVDRDTGALL